MKLPAWLEQVGFLAICLIVPVAWGWLVHWLFSRWRPRPTRHREPNSEVQSFAPGDEDDNSTFSNYQI